MISIICICNHRKVYNECLLPSLQRQRNCSYELLMINNKNNRYSNAVDAFCSVIKETTGKYLMFVHQDMILEDDYFLNKTEKFLETHLEVGIAGVAGVKEGMVYTNMYHNVPKILAGHRKIDREKEVNSLDECLFIIPKALLLEYPFDKEICHDWHLYAIEYCYRMKTMNKQVMTLPYQTYHVSSGHFMQVGYYDTLLKLAKKYRSFKRLDTPIRAWTTHPLLLKLNIMYLKRKR